MRFTQVSVTKYLYSETWSVCGLGPVLLPRFGISWLSALLSELLVLPSELFFLILEKWPMFASSSLFRLLPYHWHIGTQKFLFILMLFSFLSSELMIPLTIQLKKMKDFFSWALLNFASLMKAVQTTDFKACCFLPWAVNQITGVKAHMIFGSILVWKRVCRRHCLKSFWYINRESYSSTMDIIFTLNFTATLNNFLLWKHFASIIFTLKFTAALRQSLTLRTFCKLMKLEGEAILFSNQASP